MLLEVIRQRIGAPEHTRGEQQAGRDVYEEHRNPQVLPRTRKRPRSPAGSQVTSTWARIDVALVTVYGVCASNVRADFWTCTSVSSRDQPGNTSRNDGGCASRYAWAASPRISGVFRPIMSTTKGRPK